MKIFIGCDNIGFSLKEEIVDNLKLNSLGYEIVDCGCGSVEDTIAYPLYAQKVCEAVLQNPGSRGILICGTGLGMCISANKFKGIYATVCHDDYSCERSILSNNANVLCMGERVVAHFTAINIVRKWLSLEFKPSPSMQKIAVIEELEQVNMRG